VDAAISSPRRFDGVVLILLSGLAFALRLGPALGNRLQPDEALYATWAMHIASGRDVLLSGMPIDKPPLGVYAMAASQFVLGRVEIAARLPGFIASVVSVVLAWRWTKGLTPSSFVPHPSSLAALAMALSPFNVALGGTALLDPLMVMFGLAACASAARGRTGWGGVFLGLAFVTKVQGVLFAPLVVMTFAFSERRQVNRTSALSARSVMRFLMGFGIVAALLAGWSLARGGTPFWAQQAINYGGIRLAYSAELGPRLIAWLNWLPYIFGWPIAALLALGVVALLLRARAASRDAALDVLLMTYAIGFLAFHWLLAFPAWDRYLSILVPVMCALFARSAGVVLLHSRSQIAIKPGALWIALIVVYIIMAPDAIRAARGEIPLGGDPASRDGIDRAAAYLRDLPIGTVVYDHWLGWELGYVLWDAPVYRAYFDTATDLARDLRAFGRTSTRYVVMPAGESPAKIERAIGLEGFRLEPALTTRNRYNRPTFSVYRIAER